MKTEPNQEMSTLTKREYLASMALTGILANPANNLNSIMGVNAEGGQGFIASELAVKEAVAYADDLIAALNQTEEGK